MNGINNKILKNDTCSDDQLNSHSSPNLNKNEQQQNGNKDLNKNSMQSNKNYSINH